MCTYNGALFIDEQIETIFNQDYAIHELVVVDDLSTDETWDKLQAWKKKDVRVQLHRNEVNLGYNKNFEKALLLAKGDLLAIADQDDIWLPAKIGRQVSQFKNEKVMLSHTRSVRFEKGRLRYKSASLFNHFSGNDTRRLFMFNQVNGHDMMVRKELVQKSFPLPDGMMYDWWLAVMATCYGTIASVDEYLVHHRIHEQNSFFNEKAPQKKQPDLPQFLEMFSEIKVLPPAAQVFLEEFRSLLRQHENVPAGALDKDLFRFLLKNSKIIFGHKKRWLPALHYLKSARKYARFDFRGKGISI